MIFKKQLPNGLRIVHEESFNNEICSICIICDFGSAYENDKTRGYAHAIEHMVFKGTSTQSGNEILKTFDNIGAVNNATTTKKYTSYTVKCLNSDLDICLKTMGSMLLDSTFPAKEYNKEKHVIREENLKDENDFEYLIDIDYSKIMYKNSSYEHPVDIIQYHNTFSDLKELYKMYKQFYLPHNFVISVCSAHKMNSVVKSIENSHFNKSYSIDKHNYNIQMCKTNYTEMQMYTKIVPKMHTNLIFLGFKTSSLHSPDVYVLQILNNILSVGMSSVLFSEFREKRGLTYSTYCETTYFKHAGDFLFNIECDPEKYEAVLKILVKVINNIIHNGIDGMMLKKAKQSIKAHFQMEMEDSDTFSYHNAVCMIQNLHNISYKKLFDSKYKNITLPEVNQLIKKYFYKDNMVFTSYLKKSINSHTIRRICDSISNRKN